MNKLISLSGGGGEVIAAYWAHDKNFILAYTHLSQSPIEASEIAFHNNDENFFSCIGKKVFKCFRKIAVENEKGKSYVLKDVCK